MPVRREIPRLKFEDATTDDYDERLPQGSDDELDETARAVKRRRIEALGESYLRGKPLFISSASLRGPFDGGWVNPWRKNRKHHGIDAVSTKSGTHLSPDIIPETDKSRNKNVGGKSVRSGGPDLRLHSPRSASRSETQQSKHSWVRQSATPQEAGGTSSDVPPAQNWLKKEKKSINIQNYDPPKSPSNRYTSSGVSAAAKRPKSSRMKPEPALPRAIKPHQTDLRNVRRDKPISADSQEKRPRAGTSGGSSISPGEHSQFRSKTKRTNQLETSRTQTDGRLSESPPKNGDTISPMVEFVPPKSTTAARASSIHVIPPSSHLPEFKYRLANTHSMEESDKPPEQFSLETERAASGETFPKNFKTEIELVPVQTSTATLGSLQNQNENSTESEKIPSAQIVPKPLGTSDCFISLHSTEIGGLGPADTGTEDGELSTQAAFELAQKSFQDDLATPQRGFQYLPPTTTKRGGHSSAKRITPFANVNESQSMLDIKIGSKNTPGATHNMNTQAMIDAITPFSEATPQISGTKAGRKSLPKADVINSQVKKTISFAASPRPLSRSVSLDRSSLKEGQDSEHESLPPLPLTLSGTTPTTNQQDGQGFLFSVDAFDVSQVIQDAGSWLQQSWDVSKEVKRGIRSTGKDTQSSPPSSRHELTLI